MLLVLRAPFHKLERVSEPLWGAREGAGSVRGLNEAILLPGWVLFQHNHAGGVCAPLVSGIWSKADSDSGGTGWGQRCCILTSPQVRMLVWDLMLEGQGSRLRSLPLPLPVSDPSCLSLGQRWRCTNSLGQGVDIFVTSTELWGLTHLNDILNSLERCWARNGNGSKYFLGNRKPNIYFFNHYFPLI